MTKLNKIPILKILFILSKLVIAGRKDQHAPPSPRLRRAKETPVRLSLRASCMLPNLRRARPVPHQT